MPGRGLMRAFDAPGYREPQKSGATTDWPPKRRVRRRQAAAGVVLRGRLRTRGRGEGLECPGGTRAHHEHEAVVGDGGEGLTVTCGWATVAVGAGEERRRVWLYGASPFDSLDAELADVVAERLVVVDLIGALSIDGDERRAAADR